MPEETPLPDLFNHPETNSAYNPFYTSIAKNQAVFREEGPGMFGYHEMPRVSEKIEQNMKWVFTGYLDPAYPRVIVARRMLTDIYTPVESPFNYYASLLKKAPSKLIRKKE